MINAVPNNGEGKDIKLIYANGKQIRQAWINGYKVYDYAEVLLNDEYYIAGTVRHYEEGEILKWAFKPVYGNTINSQKSMSSSMDSKNFKLPIYREMLLCNGVSNLSIKGSEWNPTANSDYVNEYNALLGNEPSTPVVIRGLVGNLLSITHLPPMASNSLANVRAGYKNMFKVASGDAGLNDLEFIDMTCVNPDMDEYYWQNGFNVSGMFYSCIRLKKIRCRQSFKDMIQRNMQSNTFHSPVTFNNIEWEIVDY